MKNLKQKAIELRKKGFSLREISEKLEISKSTASLWLGGVELSNDAKNRIEGLRILARIKSIATKKKKSESENDVISQRVDELLKKTSFSKNHIKIACALLYWCEGGKFDNGVTFMNSDPEMIGYFMHTLRSGFNIDENKFRALIHLHDYHNEKDQMQFWSDITKIPVTQFMKSYHKENTGKVKRKNYPGCLSVRYYDKKIFTELMLIYRGLSKTIAGFV